MQSTMAGFRLHIPGLEDYPFPPGTTILLTGRPGVGKSVFAQQLAREGLGLGQHVITALTDTSADAIRGSSQLTGRAQFHALEFLRERPRLINDISIVIHQLIAKLSPEPIRLIFDSLSTLGTMFNPGLLAPWVLDQRGRFFKHNWNVLALLVYDTGIHPPSITRSLQALSDVVLEMRMEEAADEPKRLFRVYSTRGTPHSVKWFPFTVGEKGVSFGQSA